MQSRSRMALVALLRQAYSGELGAAIAYRGHVASLFDPAERARVHSIRLEELDHRRRIGRSLDQLGAQPDCLLELRNRCLGLAIGGFCHVGGWFLPMWGAGWIELRNIREYERAARLAAECDELGMAEDLLDMAEVEWEHERFFRLKAASHWGARLLRVWQGPGPKAAIRAALAASRDERADRGLLAPPQLAA